MNKKSTETKTERCWVCGRTGEEVLEKIKTEIDKGNIRGVFSEEELRPEEMIHTEDVCDVDLPVCWMCSNLFIVQYTWARENV